jgi:hypothetical protein
MFRRSIVALTVFLVCALNFPAEAIDYPYKFHQEQNIDTHQVGWIDVAIDAQGHGLLTHNWSNGKRTSGNTFYSIVVFANKDGKQIYADKQTKGIDGSWGGHAREGHVSTHFDLNAQQMADFDHVVLKMGTMNCGVELTEFKCCNNGIEATFSTKKCK